MTQDVLFPFTAIDHPSHSYIVIDLEWNQPIPWIKTSIDPKSLPGEIIEIGAVKLTLTKEGYVISKPFHAMIRPRYYTVMNKNVSIITNKLSSDLKNGISFPEAFRAFHAWCGDDYVFCGWGNSDLPIWKSNLRLHGLDSQINTLFLDVQPLFARVAEGVTNQRSVEYAVDFLHIAKNDDFHSAHRDAEYTARILRELFLLIDVARMTEDAEQPRTNTDIPVEQLSQFRLSHYLQNPDLHAETVRRTENYASWAQCFDQTKSLHECCPACGNDLKGNIEWFRLKKSAFSMWYCEDHHMIQGRMRMKKTPEGKFFATVSVRLIDPGSARTIYERYEEYLTFGPSGKPFEPPVALQPEQTEESVTDAEERPPQDPYS